MLASLEHLASSKLLLGIAILLANVGGKYVQMELGRVEEKVLQSPWVRRLILFCLVWSATRDFLAAVLVTLLFLLVVRRGSLLAPAATPRPEERA